MKLRVLILGLATVWPGFALTLQEAVDFAAKTNPEVQMARLQTTAAELEAFRAKTALRPQLSVSVGAAYQTTNLQGIGLIFPGLPARVGPYRTFDARPVLTATVYDATLRANVKAATERIWESAQSAVALRERTQLIVITTYLAALQADSRNRAALARIENAEASLKQVKDRVDAGTANKLDLARATEQVDRERAIAIEATRDREVLVTMLMKHIGLSTTELVSLSEVAPAGVIKTAMQDIEQQALTSRAEVLSLDAKRKALVREVEAASKQRWPKLSVFGNYGVLGSSPNQSLSTYAVGGTVTVPIYTGRRIETEVKQALLKLQLMDQEKRQVENAIRQEVNQAIAEWRGASALAATRLKVIGSAKEAMELAKLRYEAGLTTNLDVVTAQSSLSQAEEEEIHARYDMLIARARVAGAQGNVVSFFDSAN